MTSEVRRLTLEDRISYMDTSTLPEEGGCNLLCLSDRQVAMIRAFVFPFVRWPTRWVTPWQGRQYDTTPDAPAALADEIDDLDLQVNGGSTVSLSKHCGRYRRPGGSDWGKRGGWYVRMRDARVLWWRRYRGSRR